MRTGILFYAPFRKFLEPSERIGKNKEIEILSSGFERIPQVTKALSEEEAGDVRKNYLEKIERGWMMYKIVYPTPAGIIVSFIKKN